MKNIALIFAFQENSLFARKLIRGITAYRKEHRMPWQTHLVDWPSFDPKIFKRQQYDGIIGILPPGYNPAGVPCIHIAGHRIGNGSDSYCIGQDNESMVRMAVEHLWRKGYRRLALCGYPRSSTLLWQEERIEAFRQVCADYGAVPDLLFPGRRAEPAEKKYLFLEQALKSLAVPAGIVAINDFRALDVMEAVKRARLRIPEQIAVAGIDNDEMLCSISTPPLTSIEHFPEKKGYHAAGMLDALLRGEREIPSFVPSLQLVERGSTHTLVHENQPLRIAMEYIQHNAGSMLRTEDVAQASGVSRAAIERIFRTDLRSSVNREITAARVSLAKRRLSETDTPLKEIAVQCGFRNVHYFTTVLKKCTGLSPGAYRAAIRKNLNQDPDMP